jgi:ActR/RegA family two-component response regulator
MSTPIVLLLCDDLMFGSRIGAAARSAGAEMKTVKTADALITAVSESNPTCVIADLSVAGDRIEDCIAAISRLSRRPTVIGYGSHVDTARLRAAVKAGCDVVLPRSKFVEALEADLPQWLAPRSR